MVNDLLESRMVCGAMFPVTEWTLPTVSRKLFTSS